MESLSFANLLVLFITGLTTGGLSCLAVQGGLLASSLSHQVERDVAATPRRSAQLAAPIAGFLLAKLAAYTLLGFLLGALGSVFQMTPLTRAVLMLAVGVFMIGNALRLLNVHPIFRFFNLEPPKFLTRYIRRKARSSSEGLLAPVFLGALTVFIPCGVTQTMMALAVGAGSPWAGAAILFAFTLGTSPVFFAVAFLTTQLGARLEKNFRIFVAVVTLILGLVTVDAGLNLAGAPFAVSRLWQANSAAPTAAAAPADENAPLVLEALNDGYAPEVLMAKAGQPLELHVVTNNTRSCSRAFVIPALKVEKLLPATGTEIIQIPPQTAGTVMPFTCSMGMYGGQIRFQ